MVLRALKHYLRRRQLARHGVTPRLSVPTVRDGARSGVWTVCPNGLTPDSVVWSFGVGDNIAWDLAMIRRFGVEVHAFDPTPAAIRWIRGQTLPPRFHFHDCGLAAHDGVLRFLAPRKAGAVNYTPIAWGEEGPSVTAPVRRLATLWDQLGRRPIDVLKMDIEGGEYEVIDDLLASGVPVRQLLVEFHHHFPSIGLAKTLRAVRALEAAGFHIFHISQRGLEFSFVHGA
ncbi:MAG TPA: FkbM family methyltransferase [Gemmataceae bacterium]|nr:FkbM family methyltransferase [Gemmataceae bacterium]